MYELRVPTRLTSHLTMYAHSGSGLAEMPSMSRPTASIIPAGARYYPVAVTEFSPTTNSLTTSDASTISFVLSLSSLSSSDARTTVTTTLSSPQGYHPTSLPSQDW